LPDDERSRILIILEELFTNAIRYGYPEGASNGHIEITMAVKPGRIEIAFCDDGAAFDRLARELTTNQSPSGEQPEGGQGLQIIRSLAHRARYRRDSGRNRLALVRKLGG